MTYTNQARAEQVADALNGRYGYGISSVVPSDHGWTVVTWIAQLKEQEKMNA